MGLTDPPYGINIVGNDGKKAEKVSMDEVK